MSIFQNKSGQLGSIRKAHLGPALGRCELRETGGAFPDGPVSRIVGKSGWVMSEQAGRAHP